MRKILVEADKNFIIEIPDDAKITYGPWSPPTDKQTFHGRGETLLTGTLRIYKGAQSTGHYLAMYTGVKQFRDMTSINYAQIRDLPICRSCKANEIAPGDDVCRPCAGQVDDTPDPEDLMF